MQAHRFPDSLPRSTSFRITANGCELDVLHHPAGDWASLECDGPVEVEIAAQSGTDQAIVRPLSRGIESRPCGGCARFTIPAPQYLAVEIPGHPLLFLYVHAPALPAPEGPHVRRFEAGKVHEAGEIVLRDGETCWIDAGAVVRGCIFASGANNVRLGGYGVLDGAYWNGRDGRKRFAVFDRCHNVLVEDILMLGPSGWMLVLGGCDGADVRRLRQIADGYSTDGIDIVGSRNVRIAGCCLRNGDDNIAIKSFRAGNDAGGHFPWDGTVEDVRVSGCMFYNTLGGSAMEIGFETATQRIHAIRFEDNDVLAVHNFGSVFGIHNGDRAVVENVVWDDIRVEHHYDKLVDFRTLLSRWNRDEERGHIRDVVLRNIRAMQNHANAGYTISVMSGFDARHPVENVRFENFELGGRKVLHADMLDLVTRHAHGISFQ